MVVCMSLAHRNGDVTVRDLILNRQFSYSCCSARTRINYYNALGRSEKLCMHKPVMQFADCLIRCLVRPVPHFQTLWTPILIKLPFCLAYVFVYVFCTYVYFDM